VTELVHGTANDYGYEHARCRCDLCTRAHRDRMRGQRARRAVRLIERKRSDGTVYLFAQGAAYHGKQGTYSNRGCRCDPCVEANKLQCREWKKRQKRKSA
jgi:hypothetical protein